MTHKLQLTALALLLACLAAACEMSDGSLLTTGKVEQMMQAPQSWPDQFTALGTKLFFSYTTTANGTELWTYNGSTTKMVADINPGAADSKPGGLVALGTTRIFFTATDATYGSELWTTTGTTTTRLTNLPGDAWVLGVTVAGAYAVAAVSNHLGELELWKSNGTTSGTSMMANLGYGWIEAYSTNGNKVYFVYTTEDARYLKSVDVTTNTVTTIMSFTTYNQVDIKATPSKLWIAERALSAAPSNDFQLEAPSNEDHLYAYDYTTGQATWLMTADPETISLMNEANGQFYFLGAGLDDNNNSEWRSGLWVSNGTTANTYNLCTEIALDGAPRHTVMNKMMFVSSGTQLWRSNGTPGGTVSVADVGGNIDELVSTSPTSSGAVVYTTHGGTRLFKSTSTSTTATALAINDTTVNLSYLIAVSTSVFYADFSRAENYRLFKHTLSGLPTLIKTLTTPANSLPVGLFNANGTVYFAAHTDGYGYEPYKSTGTSTGTSLFKNITTQPASASSTAFKGRVMLGTTLYFGANNQIYKSTSTTAAYTGAATFGFNNPVALGTTSILFTSGRTTAQGPDTSLLKITSNSATPTMLKSFCSIENLAVFNGKIYFSGDDCATGKELWVSDGTTAGTGLVADIAAGGNASAPQSFKAAGSKLYFSASTPFYGRELYATDGTVGAVAMIKNINLDSDGVFPDQSFGVVGSEVCFTGDAGYNIPQLWCSDGSEAGTLQVPGPVWVRSLVTASDGLYFAADVSYTGSQVFSLKEITDPVTQGKSLVLTQLTSYENIWLTDVQVVGSKVFYVADLGNGLGFELYLTTAPATPVKDIFAGEYDSEIREMTNVNGTLYFVADNGINGLELWKSNGTAAGTVMIKDII